MISNANKTHFHKKDCASSLILKVRVFGTRTSEVAYWSTFSNFQNIARNSRDVNFVFQCGGHRKKGKAPDHILNSLPHCRFHENMRIKAYANDVSTEQILQG